MKRVEAELSTWYGLDGSPEASDIRSDLEDRLYLLLRGGRLRLRVPIEAFEAIMADGMLRPLVEPLNRPLVLGQGDADDAEASDATDADRPWRGEFDQERHARCAVEGSVFVLYSQSPNVPAPRPIYGYVVGTEDEAHPSDLDVFGEVILELDASKCLGWVTFCLWDSLQMAMSSDVAESAEIEASIAPSCMLRPHWTSAALRKQAVGDPKLRQLQEVLALENISRLPAVDDRDEPVPAYAEIQIHQRVTLDMIERVYLPEAAFHLASLVTDRKAVEVIPHETASSADGAMEVVR